MNNNLVCIDFDGVINSYTTKYTTEDDIPDKPVPGAREFITKLIAKGFKVCVFTTRATSFDGYFAVKKWLEANNIPYSSITATKLPAKVYLDDRAVTFNGVFSEELLETITTFKTWRD